MAKNSKQIFNRMCLEMDFAGMMHESSQAHFVCLKWHAGNKK
jgi:hypothetical protein